MSKHIKIIGGFEGKYGIPLEDGYLNVDAILFYKTTSFRDKTDDRYKPGVTILLPCGSWFFTRMDIGEFERLLHDAQFNEKFKKETL